MGLLDTEQPSAISQMLSLLATNRAAGQPGQQPPLPVAPMMLPSGGPRVGTTPSAGMTPNFNLPSPRPMPRMGLLSDGSGVPPGYENHQNLLGHMRDFISSAVGGGENLLGKVHDIAQNQLVGDAPQGYDSLLSPDEIQRAKPGILSSLAGGTYTHNLDHLVAMHQLATAVGEQKRVMQARHDMADMFPAQPNETPGETEGRIGQMYTYALDHGDLEMAKAIASGGVGRQATRLAPQDKTYQPKPFTLPGGGTTWVTPGDDIPQGAVPYHAPMSGNRTTGVAPAPIRTVQTQLKMAEDDLRHANSVKAPGLLATDDEKAAYGRVQSAIPAMKQRRDSLSTALDNMAAQQQGHAPAPVTPRVPTPSHPTRSTVQSQDEYDHLKNDLKWSDAKISQTYNISKSVRRAP